MSTIRPERPSLYLGIHVAHSGTVIGLLLDPDQADGSAMAAYLAAYPPDLESISLNRMVRGGPRVAVRGTRAR